MFRLLILTALTSGLRAQSTTLAATKMTHNCIKAVDFEVFGRVQGVFFRKYTKEQAERLNLRGWCKNTSQGTVLGHVEGPPDKIETMMNWLKNEGSPSSKIEKAEFKKSKKKFLNIHTKTLVL